VDKYRDIGINNGLKGGYCQYIPEYGDFTEN